MKHILLVENHPGMQNSIKDLLSEMGHEVTVASSLEEAKAIIAKNIFDVLITDTNLITGESDHGGLEVAEEFAKFSPEGKIYAMSLRPDYKDLWKDKCHAFINKRCLIEELTAVLGAST